MDYDTGIITTFAGPGTTGNLGTGGLATDAWFSSSLWGYNLKSVAVDKVNGDVFAIETEYGVGNCIRRISSIDGKIYDYFGDCEADGAVFDGLRAIEATFGMIAGAIISPDVRSLFVVGYSLQQVIKIGIDSCNVDYYTEYGKAVLDNGELTCFPCPIRSSTRGLIAQTTCVCDDGKGTVGEGTTLECLDTCGELRYNPETRECEECPYPYVATVQEPESCNGVHIAFVEIGQGTLLGILALIYSIDFLLSRDTDGKIAYMASLGLYLYTVIPTIAFFADMTFIFSLQFLNEYVFWVTVGVILSRGALFFGQLYLRGVNLRFPILSFPDKLMFDEYDTSYKCYATFAVAIPWLIINSPFIILWGIFGLFLAETNLFAITEIQNYWSGVWTGQENPYELLYGDVIDVYAMNNHLLYNTLYVSPSMLVIEAIAISLSNDGWGGIGGFCFAASLLNFFYGLYRLVHWKYINKENMLQIPLVVNLCGYSLRYDVPKWRCVNPGQHHFEHPDPHVKAMLNKYSLADFKGMVTEMLGGEDADRKTFELNEQIEFFEEELKNDSEALEVKLKKVIEKLKLIGELISSAHMKEYDEALVDVDAEKMFEKIPSKTVASNDATHSGSVAEEEVPLTSITSAEGGSKTENSAGTAVDEIELTSL